jgi:transcriptional regulator with XRE-family HTH domain
MVDGPAAGQAALRFGGLLRQLRDQAGLTQDELAEAARVSQRAISDLERGINATARKDTAVLLAGALGLDGSACELFIAAARGRAPADKALPRRQRPGRGAGGGQPDAAAGYRRLHRPPGRARPADGAVGGGGRSGWRRGGVGARDRRDGRDRQADYLIRVPLAACLARTSADYALSFCL